jgi:hypothetical protein
LVGNAVKKYWEEKKQDTDRKREDRWSRVAWNYKRKRRKKKEDRGNSGKRILMPVNELESE